MAKLLTSLPLEKAASMIDCALQTGAKQGMSPLTVIVLDAGGHMVAMKRSDGSGILRVEVAQGKAYGALGMGIPSSVLGANLADRPSFLNALAVASSGRFIPVAGGVLICDGDDLVIGSVGISGDASDKDEYCAIVAIQSVGYGSIPAEPAKGLPG
ncbi:MAG: hypothetical protein ACI9MF_002757 [Gammaproteobacteria bacterium]|jgi:uncharacterized protein GlcG (DUF336 family)